MSSVTRIRDKEDRKEKNKKWFDEKVVKKRKVMR